MRFLIVVLALIALTNAATIRSEQDTIRYDNSKVYQLNIKNKTQLAIIDFIKDLTDKYNIWKDYDEISKEIHVMVKPSENDSFAELLAVYEFDANVLIENVQDLIDAENDYPLALSDNSFGWTRFHKLHEILEWLDGILAEHPTVTEGFVIGQTYEGRDIRGIKISYKPNNPGIFIESNVHAREWITSATVTWFINELLTSSDGAVRDLAENYDWYIIPVYNVDGFVYSHETDRMWRKSRQPAANSACIGADINRNFDSYWMVNGGASSNPCSETYAGSAPYSEREAKALADYVESIKHKLHMYISFHSYGQYVLSPYGHTDERPENYDDIMAVAGAFATAVQNLQYGTVYTYGPTSTVLYYASGTSVDWAYNTQDIKLAYTFEFRDKGRYGFILPPVQILPNCDELRTGMIALVAKARELNYFN